MWACTHKRDIPGSGVIIIEENFVQICLIIADISHCENVKIVKCDIDLHFQVQLMWCVLLPATVASF